FPERVVDASFGFRGNRRSGSIAQILNEDVLATHVRAQKNNLFSVRRYAVLRLVGIFEELLYGYEVSNFLGGLRVSGGTCDDKRQDYQRWHIGEFLHRGMGFVGVVKLHQKSIPARGYRSLLESRTSF